MVRYDLSYLIYNRGENPSRVINEIMRCDGPVVVDIVSRRYFFFRHPPMPHAWYSFIDELSDEYYEGAELLTKEDGLKAGSGEFALTPGGERISFDSTDGSNINLLLKEGLERKDREKMSELRRMIRHSWRESIRQALSEHKGSALVVPILSEGGYVSRDDANLWGYIVDYLMEMKVHSEQSYRREFALFVKPHIPKKLIGGRRELVLLRESDKKRDEEFIDKFKDKPKNVRIIRIEEQSGGRIIHPVELMKGITYGTNQERIQFPHLTSLEQIFKEGFLI